MAETTENQLPVAPPNSIAQASVDDKGRLKFPAEFQAYLEARGVKKLFITSFDGRQGRVYSIADWYENLKLLESSRQNAAAAKRVAFTAKVFGGEAEIDKSGRALVPAKLREQLKLDGRQPVWLDVYQDRINLVTEAEYNQRMADAMENAASDIDALEGEGLR